MEPNGIERSIGRLEGKLDQVIAEVSGLRSAFTMLESGRLTAIEKQVATITAKMAVLASGLSVAISIAIALFQRYIL